jgi:hypothetical protein
MRTDTDDTDDTATYCPFDDWSMSVEGLTVRRALDEVGLRAPARFYPEWACAEAFLLVLLRTGQRLPSATVYRRAGEVGLRRSAIRRAGVRLGVISTRQRGIRQTGWIWSLPCDLVCESCPSIVLSRWQRQRELG